jgi:hypothetical protein
LSARPSDDRHRERVAILAVDEERTLFALADENISTIQIHSVGASTPHRAHPSRALRAPPCPDVRTKRAKTFTTWFFPVGDDIRQMVVDWVAYLRGEKGFGPDDPLFPKTTVAPGKDLAFRAVSLDHAPWANANPVRDIFRDPASGQDYRISTRTCCGTRSSKLLMIGSSTPKPLRLGHRTSGMKAV